MAGAEEGVALYSYVAEVIFGGSALAAISFMTFNLLCAPCFAAMGAIKREMNNGKWTAFAITYMCAFAYLTSFVIYNIGAAFEGAFHWWEAITFVLSLLIIAAVVFLMTRKKLYTDTSEPKANERETVKK